MQGDLFVVQAAKDGFFETTVSNGARCVLAANGFRKNFQLRSPIWVTEAGRCEFIKSLSLGTYCVTGIQLVAFQRRTWVLVTPRAWRQGRAGR